MIRITVKKNKNDIYNGMRIEGHAKYDDFGKDIVCAAVSALVINTINSLETFSQDLLQTDVDEADGIIEFEIISPIGSNARLLLDSLLLGLKGIADDYGTDYIQMK